MNPANSHPMLKSFQEYIRALDSMIALINGAKIDYDAMQDPGPHIKNAWAKLSCYRNFIASEKCKNAKTCLIIHLLYKKQRPELSSTEMAKEIGLKIIKMIKLTLDKCN